jgi:hypothetical protein
LENKQKKNNNHRMSASHDNPKNKLQELLQKAGCKLPIYETKSMDSGFQCQLSIPFTGTSQRKKKEAEMNAAAKAIELLERNAVEHCKMLIRSHPFHGLDVGCIQDQYNIPYRKRIIRAALAQLEEKHGDHG